MIWGYFISHILLLSRLYTNVNAVSSLFRRVVGHGALHRQTYELGWLSYLSNTGQKVGVKKNSARFARRICPPLSKPWRCRCQFELDSLRNPQPMETDNNVGDMNRTMKTSARPNRSVNNGLETFHYKPTGRPVNVALQ